MSKDDFERTLRLLGMEFELGGEGLDHFVQKNVNYVVEHSQGDWDERVAEQRVKYLEGE